VGDAIRLHPSPPTPEIAATEGKGGHSMSLEKMREGAVLAIENLEGFVDNS
tara:strand:- start:2919 stop:3071 length:153 start_codon:yes stop_codon:yes gene_type:complete